MTTKDKVYKGYVAGITPKPVAKGYVTHPIKKIKERNNDKN